MPIIPLSYYTPIIHLILLYTIYAYHIPSSSYTPYSSLPHTPYPIILTYFILLLHTSIHTYHSILLLYTPIPVYTIISNIPLSYHSYLSPNIPLSRITHYLYL